MIETSGHKAPEELVPRLKSNSARPWIHKCVGLRYAKKAVSLGADIITVVGYENGGATGMLDLGTFVLIPAAASALSVPVIGGGGVSNGRSLVAALALGAAGRNHRDAVPAHRRMPHPSQSEKRAGESAGDRHGAGHAHAGQHAPGLEKFGGDQGAGAGGPARDPGRNREGSRGA